MCIIFIWRKESSEIVGQFKFILAANRDEYFKRPAKHADFWNDCPHVLGGQDLTEGVQGGTWLGITKTGNLSALTNIASSDPNKQARQGRGFLISKYLAGQENGKTYLENLRTEKNAYRPFNIIVGNIKGDLFYTNNLDEKKERRLEEKLICLTNDTLNCKWLKSVNSEKLFENIVNTYTDKDLLVKELFSLLEDTTINFPDNAIQGEYFPSLTSIYVPLYQSGYGTRTNTVILLDREDNVTFIERTKTEIEQKPEEWSIHKYEFKLD